MVGEALGAREGKVRLEGDEGLGFGCMDGRV